MDRKGILVEAVPRIPLSHYSLRPHRTASLRPQQALVCPRQMSPFSTDCQVSWSLDLLTPLSTECRHCGTEACCAPEHRVPGRSRQKARCAATASRARLHIYHGRPPCPPRENGSFRAGRQLPLGDQDACSGVGNGPDSKSTPTDEVAVFIHSFHNVNIYADFPLCVRLCLLLEITAMKKQDSSSPS